MKNHNLYETGDPDAPSIIKDQNGEVALAMRRDCKRAESDLTEHCSVEQNHFCFECGHALDVDATFDVGCEHCGTEW